MPNDKLSHVRAIEKARPLTLQKASDNLIRRAIQDIEQLVIPQHISAGQVSHYVTKQRIKKYDPYARYEIGDLIYKDYDETLTVGSRSVEHFKGSVILKVVGRTYFKSFNCDMIEVDYDGGSVFRKYVDYMKKTKTQILLPSNVEGRNATVELFDVNTRDPEGLTPLENAIVYGNVNEAELLISTGADINAKDLLDETPLHTAVHEGHKDIVGLLIAKGADVNANNDLCETPLHIAARTGNKDIAELLISKGADVNAKTGDKGWVPLHAAVLKGNKEIAELLIAKGADINARIAEDGFTPLFFAAQEGYDEVAGLLIARGADITEVWEDGLTPLHIVAYWGRRAAVAVAELLINNGANINAKTDQGDTPLRLAQYEGHKDMAELLMKHGAHE